MLIFTRLFQRKSHIAYKNDGTIASDRTTADICREDEGEDGAGPEDDAYEVVEFELHPANIVCPDCGGITKEGLDFCDKCGGELN